MSSLYVHIPFCLSKCSYCAFYSVPVSGIPDTSRSDFLEGLAQEIELRRKEAPMGVSSLFLGGGTPTVLRAGELEQLLSEIHRKFVFQSQAEKTVEANPGTLTAAKLAVLCRYGINRISLGAQSFDDTMLKRIGRIHTTEDIRSGVRLLRNAGIQNLNLDLIFGLPGQTLDHWQKTLQQAVELDPEHLSVYALTLEEDTPMGEIYLTGSNKNQHLQAYQEKDAFFPLPDDDLQADMYDWAVQYLQEMGYQHYEISNFAKPHHECRHNQAYWLGEEYLGLGPGAVSCLTGVRTKNTEDLEIYNQLLRSGKKPFDPMETETLTRDQLISEYMMLGLRTAQGVDCNAFQQRFNSSVQDIYGQILVKYINRDILRLEYGRLKLQEKYYFIANSILQDFIL